MLWGNEGLHSLFPQVAVQSWVILKLLVRCVTDDALHWCGKSIAVGNIDWIDVGLIMNKWPELHNMDTPLKHTIHRDIQCGEDDSPLCAAYLYPVVLSALFLLLLAVHSACSLNIRRVAARRQYHHQKLREYLYPDLLHYQIIMLLVLYQYSIPLMNLLFFVRMAYRWTIDRLYSHQRL
mmetsp:Transcript_110088/g.215802  ORF Transcript_110088/g.215802 Transcript_110088/m.215802 type:complete len:179 (+) Transcript_110088:217-753(+)